MSDNQASSSSTTTPSTGKGDKSAKEKMREKLLVNPSTFFRSCDNIDKLEKHFYCLTRLFIKRGLCKGCDACCVSDESAQWWCNNEASFDDEDPLCCFSWCFCCYCCCDPQNCECKCCNFGCWLILLLLLPFAVFLDSFFWIFLWPILTVLGILVNIPLTLIYWALYFLTCCCCKSCCKKDGEDDSIAEDLCPGGSDCCKQWFIQGMNIPYVFMLLSVA